MYQITSKPLYHFTSFCILSPVSCLLPFTFLLLTFAFLPPTSAVIIAPDFCLLLCYIFPLCFRRLITALPCNARYWFFCLLYSGFWLLSSVSSLFIVHSNKPNRQLSFWVCRRQTKNLLGKRFHNSKLSTKNSKLSLLLLLTCSPPYYYSPSL